MKTLILFSGGLDSTVVLAMAKAAGHQCHAVSFDYQQRHRVELKAAAKIAQFYQIPHQIIQIDPICFSTSALLSKDAILKNRTAQQMADEGIPNTYVPARNTIFLAYLLGLAEIQDCGEIHVGFNAMDALPYPDCRPAYVTAFQNLTNCATKQGVEGRAPKIIAPVILWSKQEIIAKGKELHAPLNLTFSCYNPTPNGDPCLQCDACMLRLKL